jgi:dTDP-4-dehydrorhamnose reductase
LYKFDGGRVPVMAKVAVFGSMGMLGSVLTHLLKSKNETIYEFNRSGISVTGKNFTRQFDVTTNYSIAKSLNGLEIDYIVNCIGLIKQLIEENCSNSVDLANRINFQFPQYLNSYARTFEVPLIQIGTDCVYSGKSGRYSENNPHDPIDLYGITKSLGEKSSDSSMIIRCSIVGKELKSTNSLMEWILSQPYGATINGYTNHIWNGVTTLHFAQIVWGIIQNKNYKPGVSHLVPKDIISKYELIELIAKNFGRDDLLVSKFEAETSIDRSLISVDSERNLRMWQEGGYNEIPTIGQMLSTYANWAKIESVKGF